MTKGKLIRPEFLNKREPKTIDEIEKYAIQYNLIMTGNNVKKAADRLNLPERTLYRKLSIY